MDNLDEKIENAVDLIAKKEFEQARALLEEYTAHKVDNQEGLKNLGLCYLNLENFEQAHGTFLKVTKLNPNDASAIFYLASCEEKIGETQAAIENYKKVIELREEFLDAYKNLCVLYITQGQFDSAQKYAELGIEKNNEDYQLYYFLATALISKGENAAAIEHLKHAIELNPEHQQLLNNLGSCYLAQKDYKSAQEIFEKTFEINPNNPLTNYNLGTIFQINGEYSRALNYFDEAYKIQPSIMILTSLAQCSILANDFELGAKLYRNLVALHPEKLNFKKNLLTCLIETRNLQPAIAVAQELIKLNPKAEDIQLKLAFLYRLNGQYISAITILEELIKRGRVDGEVYYEHGLNAIKLDDFDIAKSSFKKVIQLDPKNALAHKDLGMLYLYMNLVDWAEDEIKIALELEENNHYINFAYATFLNRTNDFLNADKYYKKTIEIYPKSADYLTYYAQNLVVMGKIEEAVLTLKKALDFEPLHPLARFELSKIYFSEQKYKIALKLLEDVLDTPNNVEIINLMAKIEMKLKNFENAKFLLEKLIEAHPKNHLLLADLASCCLNLGDIENAKKLATSSLSIFDNPNKAKKILDTIKELEQNNDG